MRRPRRFGRTVAKGKGGKCIPVKQVGFTQGMRKLWEDHAFWTAMAINSLVAGSEDTEAVVARLLGNQDEIGDYIKPFYGSEAGRQLASLLREHIALAAQIIGAMKAGDEKEIDHYGRLWYANADEIVDFLSKLNPHFSAQELHSKFYLHLQQVENIIAARMNEDWGAYVQAVDAGIIHIIHIADYLASGIIKQFPARFR